MRTRHRRGGRSATSAMALALVIAVVVGGCSSGAVSSSPSAAPAGSTSPSAGGAEEAGPDEFTNPVYDADFPDPQAIRAGRSFFAYATNGALGNVQTLQSEDLVAWEQVGDAMPQLASWVSPGRTWAPEVLRMGARRYVLYYTAAGAKQGRQCVGRAVAAKPSGPFVDGGGKPLVCQVGRGGSIDASPFRDADGTLYLYWKNDGNCCGQDTYLWVQRLSSDGLRLTGPRTKLIKQGQPWEGTLVEAPFMWRHDGRYFLFYSANAFNSDAYAIGYAACKGPTGPCTKAADNPLVESTSEAAGPGHMSMINDHGRDWMLYHAWPPDAVGSTVPGRLLWLDQVAWPGGKPELRGPTEDPQPKP